MAHVRNVHLPITLLTTVTLLPMTGQQRHLATLLIVQRRRTKSVVVSLSRPMPLCLDHANILTEHPTSRFLFHDLQVVNGVLAVNSPTTVLHGLPVLSVFSPNFFERS